MKTGDYASEQVVECLAQLVCLRAWTGYWQRPGTLLEISADNVTALNVADSLKSSGPAIGLIAREIALLFGNSTHRPVWRTHIPGISNKLADKLSRRHQPTDGTTSSRFSTPDIVKHLEETKLEKRDVKYYASRGDHHKL